MGVVDVDAMRHSMTPEQMDKWLVFDQMCPVGGWYETAMICATMVNLFAAASGNSSAEFATVDQFLPDCLRPGSE